MKASQEYISKSLELHLFFGRIMKEHSFFLEIGFTPKDSSYIEKADTFRKEFDKLLWNVVKLSDGVVSPVVLQSGEVFTQYTLKAEEASSFFTGISIPTEITKAERELMGSHHCSSKRNLEQAVYEINEKAIVLITSLIQFKTTILSNVLSLKMFTVNYPLLIDHILREAKFYLHWVKILQSGEDNDMDNEILEQEVFWNRIMAEHSKFIRGLLDPTEENLIDTANNFGNEFDQLTNEAKSAIDNTTPVSKVTADSLGATKALRDFKAQGTQGILNGNVQSIIIPLLGDHTIREASHYLRLLKAFSGK